MGQIIEFLEQYWGYTLIGGVSVGTIITAIVVMILNLFKNKKHGNLITSLSTVVSENSTKTDENITALTSLVDKLIVENNNYKEEIQYGHKVNAVLFKAVSYLITASKLPNADKIELQEQFTNLTKIVDEKITEIQPHHEETVKETVVKVVEHAQSLLDKYTKGE